MEYPCLDIVNISKKIKNRIIVNNINIKVYPGEIYGFLGQNGAGKTTTIRMILGLIKPSSGYINISGFSVKNQFTSAMENIGGIIESPDMYSYLTGMENLLYYKNMYKNINMNRIYEIIKLVNLEHRINDKVSIYSLGMKQRLGIAQALINKPKLLILDEPTNGLDPAGIVEFRKLIIKLSSEENMAIFISSHILSEIQKLCNRVSIINRGNILKTIDMKELSSDNNSLENIFLNLTGEYDII